MRSFYRFIAGVQRITTTNLQNALLAAPVVLGVLVTSIPASAGQDLPIRGVVRALTSSSISTTLSVPISKISKREGESFKKGDTLVTFDCARFIAEKRSLLAEKKIQELTHKNNKTLLSHNAIGEFDVEISRAKVEKADADIGQLEVRLRQCILKAPFDGRVDEVLVNQHETPKAGAAYIRILEANNLEIEFIVPSNWLQWLKIGAKFDFRIDETAMTYQGRVSHLGASVDPVSQTVKIKGTFASTRHNVFAGMSGSAKFERPES